MCERMEENGFHEPKNQFPPARTSSFLKNWFPFIVLAVSASRKFFSSKVTVFIEKNILLR